MQRDFFLIRNVKIKLNNLNLKLWSEQSEEIKKKKKKHKSSKILEIRMTGSFIYLPG